MPKLGGTRTVWDKEEKRLLAEAAQKLRAADPKLGILDALRKVQDSVLKSNRTRSLTAMNAVPNDLLQALEGTPLPLVPRADVEKLEAEKDELVSSLDAERSANADLRSQMDVLEAANQALRTAPGLEERVRSFVSDCIADGIRKAGFIDALDALTAALAGVPKLGGTAQRSEKVRHNPEPMRAADMPQLKVLLVGVPEEQRKSVKEKLRDNIDVKCWANGKLGNLTEMAKHADMTFISMDLSGKVSFDAVSQVTKKYQRVPGGYNRLVDEVSSWADRQQ